MIEGITSGPSRQPVSSALLMLSRVQTPGNQAAPQSPAQGVSWYRATSDNFGEFSFKDLAPGQYQVAAFSSGYNPSPSVLTLGAGQHITGLRIELAPLAELSGKVTDEDGNPVPGVTVNALTSEFVVNGRLRVWKLPNGVQTDLAGKYRLELPLGSYYLSFSVVAKAPVSEVAARGQPEQGYSTTTYFPGVRELSLATSIDAAAGGQLPELNVRLQKTLLFHLRGKVAGVPPDFGVYPRMVLSEEATDVLAAHEHKLKGEAVHADGTFDISGLSPGERTLVLWSDQGRILGRRTVRVSEADVEDVVIAAQPPFDLSGSVRLIPSQPSGVTRLAADQAVRVRLTSLDDISPSGPVEALARGDGTFTLKDVESGRYRVDVTLPQGGFVKAVTLAGVDCTNSGIDLSGGVNSSALEITLSMNAGQVSGSVSTPDGGTARAATVTLVPDGPRPVLYRPDLYLVTKTDARGLFNVKNIGPGTYRVYAWERLPALGSPRYGDSIVFSNLDFPGRFDGQSALITVVENESKQVSLTLISGTSTDEDRGRVP
jgi:hypothetical protein